MKNIEAEINKLRSMTEDEFQALPPEEARALMDEIRVLEAKREEAKKDKANLNDVLDSMQEIAKRLPDVDMAKASSFADVLLRNHITKWQLRVATEEIIRSRTKFTAVAEYFLAINRIKLRLQASGHNIFHENALDF